MNRISDLALDLGIFELDNQLEGEEQLSALASVALNQRILRAFQFHQKPARIPAGKRRLSIAAANLAMSR